MATVDELKEQLKKFQQHLQLKDNIPNWFTLQLKTLQSKNITLEDWNTTLSYLQTVVSDIVSEQELLNTLTSYLILVLDNFIGFNYEIVDTLPKVGIPNTLYWLKLQNNLYNVYVYTNNKFEKVFEQINFNANNFPTKQEFDSLHSTVNNLPTTIPANITYEEDGFTLINNVGEEVGTQNNKVKLTTINSKKLTEEKSLQVFEAGGEVEEAEDTDYRASKEAMLEPYVIDISGRNTLNYAEYNILIRSNQNYLIYNDSILRFEYDAHQGYCYYGNSIEVMISKTENSDRSHNIVVKQLNRIGKMFITGTNIYVSAIVAFSNTVKGGISTVPGDYVATGTYEGKTVYKLKLNIGSYREVFFTDGSTEIVSGADVNVEEL